MAKNIIEVLMEDGFITEQEAKDLIREAQDEIHAGENPRVVMHNVLCLSVDYLKEVMEFGKKP